MNQQSQSATPIHDPRVAIIGASGYAGIMLKSLLGILPDHKGSLVAATVVGEDPAAAESLTERGCEVFSDYEDMLAAHDRSLDLCIIPTSIHWHTRMSVRALLAGANVLVEKPLAGSVADGVQIVRTAAEVDRFVAVGFQDMYSPATQSIKSFLCSGRLGRVRAIRATGSWPRGRSYYERNDWAGRARNGAWAVGDSPLNNAFAHFLNLALYFAGEQVGSFAQIVRCEGELLRSYPIETFDTASIRLLVQGGVLIDCIFTHADAEQSSPQLLIDLDDGTIVWEFENHATARDRDGLEIGHWVLGSQEACRLEMLGNVLSGVSRQGGVAFTGADSLVHARAVETITSELDVCPTENERPSWEPRIGLFASLLRQSEPTL